MKRVMLVAVCLMALVGCGDTNGGGSGGAGETAAVHPGAETYTRFCFSCHAAGIAGAPRVGDVAQWQPRIAKGRDALLATAIAGIPPGMPARGLCGQCSDAELADAIDFMISKSE